MKVYLKRLQRNFETAIFHFEYFFFLNLKRRDKLKMYNKFCSLEATKSLFWRCENLSSIHEFYYFPFGRE